MKSSKTSTPKDKPTKKLKLGEAIDSMYQQDLLIRSQEKVLRDLKSKRFEMETQLFKRFDKSVIKGATGKLGKASLADTKHPQLKDRKKFWRYLVKNKAYDLVQNRIASRAYFDRLEEGEEIPGVEVFVRYKVNVRKAK